MSFASRLRGIRGVGALACTVALMAGLAVAPAARAAPISNVFVFGDSLLDVGNVSLATGGANPPAFYYNGRWSNGPLAVDLFAAHLGVTLAPSLLGGSNFAWGGAQAQIVAGGVPDLPEQINLFAATLAGTPADPNAVYVVDGGGNDIATALASANPAAYLASALNSFASSIGALAGLGAQHLLLFNVPDIGATPRVRELDAELGASGTLMAGATQLTNLFNTNLAGIVAGARSAYGIDIDVVDLYGIGKAIDANPAAYGLTNVTDACVTLQGVCATPNTYAYWDPFHPSARIGQIWSDAMIAAVPEPATLALIGIALLAFALSLRKKRK